ncbi:unnamed protein product, partial [Prorocentrum cordatum]
MAPTGFVGDLANKILEANAAGNIIDKLEQGNKLEQDILALEALEDGEITWEMGTDRARLLEHESRSTAMLDRKHQIVTDCNKPHLEFVKQRKGGPKVDLGSPAAQAAYSILLVLVTWPSKDTSDRRLKMVFGKRGQPQKSRFIFKFLGQALMPHSKEDQEAMLRAIDDPCHALHVETPLEITAAALLIKGRIIQIEATIGEIVRHAGGNITVSKALDSAADVFDNIPGGVVKRFPSIVMDGQSEKPIEFIERQWAKARCGGLSYLAIGDGSRALRNDFYPGARELSEAQIADLRRHVFTELACDAKLSSEGGQLTMFVEGLGAQDLQSRRGALGTALADVYGYGSCRVAEVGEVPPPAASGKVRALSQQAWPESPGLVISFHGECTTKCPSHDAVTVERLKE